MASNPNLRQVSEHGPDTSEQPRAPFGSPLQIAALLAVAAAGAFLLVSQLASSRSDEGRVEAPQPGFLTEALGTPQSEAPLVRKPARNIEVDLAGPAIRVTAPHGTLALGRGHASGTGPWTRHEHGAVRRTAFGSETVTVTADRVEQFLTVAERQGPRTWRWRIETGLNPRVTPEGWVGFFTKTNRLADPAIAPVAIFDGAGRDVTPKDLRWAVVSERGAWWLTLRLDDRSLPLPYVIDPSIVYRTNAISSSPSAGSLTLTIPATAVEGDLLLVHVAAENNTAINAAPAGWTDVYATDNVAGTRLVQQVFRHRVSSSDVPGTTTAAFSWPTANPAAAQMLVYKGVDTALANPVHSQGTHYALAGNSWVITLPAITTTTANTMIVGFAAVNTDVLTWPTPAGWTGRGQVAGGTLMELGDYERACATTCTLANSTATLSGGTRPNGLTGDTLSLITDTTAPTDSFSVTETAQAGKQYFDAPANRYYYSQPAAGLDVTFTIGSTITDAGSGPASTTFPTISATGFSGTGVTDTTPAYSSNPYTITSANGAAPASPTLTSADQAANNSAATTFSVVRDVTAPTGALTVNGTAASGVGTTSRDTDGSFPIDVRTDHTEAMSATASGLAAAATLVREFAAFSAFDTCGSFGSPTTITGNPSESGLASGCYRYTLSASDNVGNTDSLVTTVKVNQPPSVTVSLGPASPTTNQTLTASTTPSDPESDPVTLTYVWKKNGVTISGQTASTLDLSVAGNGDKGDTVSVEVTPSDGITSGSMVSGSATVVNSLPTATVSVAPASPKTNDTLTATIGTADADGDVVTVTRVWKKNAAVLTGETATTLNLATAGNGDKGDTLTIEVTPSDGANGSTVTSTATVANSLPTATVALNTAAPKTNDTLTTTVTTADADGDTVTVAYVWKKNGVAITGQTASSLNLATAGNGDKGDTLTVEATPSDGAAGTTVSDTATVANTLPTATVSVAPASPKTDDTLTATISTADADGDAVTVTRVWKKNGVAITGETGTSLNLATAGNGNKGDGIAIEVTPSDGAAGSMVSATATVANSLPTATVSVAPASPKTNDTLTATISTADADGDVVTVTRVWKKNAAVLTGETATTLNLATAGNGDKGDTLTIEVTPSDGANGSTVTSTATVANSLPTATVALNTASPKTNDTLTTSVTTADADGDTVTVSYVWKKNGTAISGQTASSLNLATAGNGDKGDTITVEVTPSDGASGTTVVDSATVANTLPTATVGLNTASPKTNDTLIATPSTSDADGDAVTVSYVWKKNGVAISGQTASSLNLATAGNGDKGDATTVEATPSDGASGSTVSAAATVVNSLPTATVSLSPVAPKTNDALSATISTADADGDAVAVARVWKKNAAVLTGETGTTLNLATAGNGDKGDTLTIEVTPSDGAAGSTVTATETVANSLPVAAVSLSPASPKTNDTLSASVSTSDADGDAVTVTRVWKRNGTAITGQTGSSLNLATAGNGDKGDTLTIEVTPNDGGGSGSTVSNSETVANSLPTSTVSLPASPKTNDMLSATIGTSDADGDVVTVTRVWKKNAVALTGETGASLNLATVGNGDKADSITVEVTPSDGASGSMVSAATTVANSLPTATVSVAPVSPKTNDALTATISTSDADGDAVTVTRVWKKNAAVLTGETGTSLDLSVAGNGNKGDTMTIEVTPSDGASGSTVTGTVTVANSAPVLTSVTIDQASPRTADVLSASIVAADADGDALTTTRQWRKNAVDLTGETGANLNLATAGNGDKGDSIALRVSVSDGSASDGPLTSAAVTVQNTAPVLSSVTIDQASPKTNDTLSATIVASDADGDTLTPSRQWRKNGADLTGETGPSLNLATAGNGDKADSLALRASVSDGSASAGPLTSAAVAVQNSAPTATVTLSPAAPKTNDTLTATISTADADGDLVTVTRVWKKNGSVLAGQTGSTLDLSAAGNGDEGDAITAEVTPSDGTISGTTATDSKTVGNSAPTATVSLSPPSPKTNDALTTSVTTADADGEAVTVSYVWKKNGTAIPGQTGSSLNLATAGNGDKGDAITVEVTPNDGTANGTAATDSKTVANTVPTATVSLSSASPKTNDTLTASVTTADADGDTVTVSYVWKRNGTAITGQTASSLNLATAGNGDKGDAITVEATPNDGSANGSTVSAAATVANSAPVLSSVTIDQAAPKTNDTLSATIVASDADGDSLTTTRQWRKNSVDLSGETGASLNLASAGNGDKGDNLSLRISVSDGTASDGPMTSAAVTVQNTVPTATVALNTAAPKTNDTLTTSVTTADADGDTVTVGYVWKKNGTAIGGQTGSTLNLATAGNGDKGDTITVEVTPSDGSSGTTVVDNTTVANSLPTATVALNTPSPKTNDTLTTTVTTADADGDAVTVSYVWKKNGLAISGQTASSLNLATAGNGDKGDTITVEVTPSDGASGSTVSAAATVANSLPTATVSVAPASPKTNDILTATASTSDADGDTVTVSYVWKKNGLAISGQTASTLNLATAGNGDKGDTITVEVTPSDGASGSAVTGTVTVANSAPTVSTVTIDQASPKTNDVLSVSVTSADADGDARTYSYQWAKNGVDIAFATGATLDLSQLGNGDKGDSITVRVTASDGSASSSAVTSGGVAVQNFTPVVDSAAISQAAPKTNDTLSLTITSHDDDGDAVTYAYQWRKNAVDLAGRTASTLDLSQAGNGDKGDAIAVRVTAGDGSATSAAVTSAAVTVQNTAPAATVSLSPASPKTNDTLTATAATSDADGDIVTVSYVWKKNGTAIAGQTASSLNLATAGNGDKGDTIAVEATPNDGSAGGTTVSDSKTVVNSLPTGTVSLSSASPRTNDTLTTTVTTADADGDTVTVAYAWEKNGTAIAGQTASSLNLATAGNGDKGDTIAVEVTPNDGANGTVASGTATVADSAPTATVSLAPASPRTNDTLTASTTTSDADGDAVTLSYVWKKNGSAIAGQTALTLNLATAGNGDKGDAITVEATPAGGAMVTDSVTVANSPPVLSSVSIDQAAPKTNDTLTATIVSSDADGDALTTTRQWRKNGADLSGETGASLNLATAGNGQKSDAIALQVSVSDGSASAGPTTSGAVTILNSAPSCSATTLTTIRDTANETAPVCSDADGDTPGPAIVAQGSLGTASINAGQLRYVPNASVTGTDSFTYKANDGTVDSAAATVNVTINEPVPTAPNVPVLQSPTAAAFTSATPTLTARFADVNTADTGTIEFQVCSDAGCSTVVATFSSASGIANGANGSAAPASALTDATTYHWRARATDDTARTSSWSSTRSFTVDVSGPTPAVSFPAAGGNYRAATWSSFAGTAADGGSGVGQVDVAVKRLSDGLWWNAAGSTWQSSIPPLFATAAGTGSWSYAFSEANFATDGLYELHVKATDALGTATTVTRTFRIDRVAPSTANDAPAAYRNGAVTVTLSPSDGGSGVATTTYEVNAGATQTGTSVSIPGTQGTYAITFRSTDAAGNVEADKTATVRIDTTAPTTTDDAPAGYRNGPVTVTLSPTDSGGAGVSTTTYEVNAGATLTGTTVSIPGTQGTYTITYRSTDAAGNPETTKTATVRVDTTAPTTTDNAPAAWRNGAVTVTLSPTDSGGAGVQTTTYELDGGLTQTGTSVSVPATSGAHTIVYRSTDTASNAESNRTATVNVDVTAPSVSITYPTGGALVSGVVTITTSPASDAHSGVAGVAYSYSVAGANDWQSTSSSWNTAALADGSYDVRAVVTDNAGNTGQSLVAGVQVDNNPPSLTFSAPTYLNAASASPYTLSATASDGGTGVANVEFFQQSGGSWSSIAADTTGSPYTAAWTLPADGPRTLKAVATDNVGHPTEQTVTLTVDRTPPTATMADPGAYVRGTIELSTAASDATTSVTSVAFQRSPVGGDTWTTIATDTNGADGWKANLDTTGLSDGLYDVRAFVTDAAGNSSTSTVASRRVDNTKPTAGITDPGAFLRGTVTLAGSATDGGSGVASVEFQRSPAGAATWTAIGTDTTSADGWSADLVTTALTDGLYDLRVVVTDRAGNSETSSVGSRRVDNTKPTAAIADPGQYLRGTAALTGTATDDGSGVASVEFQRSPAGTSTWTQIAVDVDGADGWSASFVTTGVTDALYDLRVVVTDRAGNSETALVGSRRVDNTKPTAAITDPGAFLRSTVTLAGSATDAGSGVASVAFERSTAGSGGPWTTIGTDADGADGWSASFDTAAAGDGLYDLRVSVTDRAGNSETATVATRRVDNTAPATGHDAPAGPAAAPVTVTLTPSDTGSGTSATQYRVDGGPWQSGTSVLIPAPADHSNDGAHTIDFYSTDAAGNVETVRSAAVVIDTTGASAGPSDPGSYLRAVVTLEASPADTSGIVSVEFQFSPAGMDAWAAVGTDLVAPYSVTWDTATVADGDYDLRVRVVDGAGNISTTNLPGLPKVVDNTSPTGSVSAPAASAYLAGTVTVSASASDTPVASAIASVQFQVKPPGASEFGSLGTATSSPYGVSWDTRAMPDGPAELRVVVTDVAGNPAFTSAVRTVNLDNNAPVVDFTHPSSDLAGTVTLTASGSADLASVTFQRSPVGAGTWTTIDTDTSSPFQASFATTAVADGRYDFRALGTDGSGNGGVSATRTMRVDNTAPAGSVTEPRADATVGGPSVALAASSSDAGSGVASASFQYRPAGGGSFTDISGSTWDATGLASGDYEVRAVIRDNAGNAHTTAAVTVNVDSTAPTVALANPGASLQGTVTLTATVSGSGATSVTFGARAGGSATWTEVGSDDTAPYTARLDTTKLSDGEYELRAVVSDQFGNTNSDVRTAIRIDNTAPRVASSSPADGSTVASVSSVAVTASETLLSVDDLRLDGAAVSVTPSGASFSIDASALGAGPHTLGGKLRDLAGRTKPFRVHFAVVSAGAPDVSYVEKNAGRTSATTLTAVDSSATVTMPADAWSDPGAGDWLVLRVDPVPAASIAGATSLLVSAIVDVTARWALAGTEHHDFSAPLDILVANTGGDVVVPATFVNGSWRPIPAIPSGTTLPAGWADGFYRDGAGAHVLTRHLSMFALLRDIEAPEPPAPSGVVAGDGLTLRWLPGRDNSGLIRRITLLVNGVPYADFEPTQFEVKMGPFEADDTRLFTFAQQDAAGNWSAESAPLRAVPQLAGKTLAEAEAALSERGFSLGSVREESSPTALPGTVIEPAGARVAAKGSAVDLVVAAGADTVADSRLVFGVVGTKKFSWKTGKSIAVRVKTTRASKVTVSLMSPQGERVYTWRFSVKAGRTVRRLPMPRQVTRPGKYRLVVTATSGTQVVRKTIRVEIVPSSPTDDVGRAPRRRAVEIVLAGSSRIREDIALGLDTPATRIIEADGGDAAFDATADPRRNVQIVVVDVDRHGVGLVRDLRIVFPSVKIVAMSRRPELLLRALRAGAAAAMPPSTPPTQFARVIRGLSRRP